MLRPATPLMIFFFVAFILLLLSTISAPIVASIPIGKGYDNHNHSVYYGVFGYCDNTRHVCSSVSLGQGYNPKNIQRFGFGSNLHLSQQHQLSELLIVHLIATVLSFVCTVLAASAHFRSPAHSPRFLLALLIVSFPTLFVALLAFLVDVLLFAPRVGWAGWVALAATIILTSCTVLTCAMRRTLVNRKARKQRIAENAEMNGDNYNEQLTQQEQQLRMRQIAEDSQLTRAESPPPMPGKFVTSDVTEMNVQPAYATFEYERSRSGTNDRTLLNSTAGAAASQTPFNIGAGAGPGGRPDESNGSMDPRERSRNRGAPGDLSRNERIRDDLPPSPVSPIDDEPPANFPPRRGPPDPRNDPRRGARGGPVPPYGMRGGGAPPPMYGRGRGGYPPRGYGPPRGRGMYPPPPGGGGGTARGYYRPGDSQGMGEAGPSPPGWHNDERGMEMGAMLGAGAGMAAGGAAIASRGGRPPPPGYGNTSQANGSDPYPSRGDNSPYSASQYSRNDANQGYPYGDDTHGRLPDVRQQQQQQQQQQRRKSQDSASRPMPGQWLSNDSYNSRSPEPPSSQNQRHEMFGALDEPSSSPLGPVPRYQRDEQVQPSQPLLQEQQQQQQRPSRPTELTRSADSFGFSGRHPSPIQNANSPRGSSPPPPMPPPINTQNLTPRDYDVDTSTSNVEPGSTHDFGRSDRGENATRPRGDSRGQDYPPSMWQPQTQAVGTLEQDRRAGSSETARMTTTQRPRKSSDAYYEDVSPRFATEEQNLPPFPLGQAQQPTRDATMPSTLMPGYGNQPGVSHTSSMYSEANANDPSRNESRSPAASEASHFTSISQRGINPNWQPPPMASQPGPQVNRGYGSSGFSGRPPPTAGSQRWNDQEVVLSANPDFIVPGPGDARPGHLRGMSGSHHYPDPL